MRVEDESISMRVEDSSTCSIRVVKAGVWIIVVTIREIVVIARTAFILPFCYHSELYKFEKYQKIKLRMNHIKAQMSW